MDAKRTPEIERHQAKLAKDPTSRVFAQLADAYRKEGLLDEAISICLKGLEQHPHYPSAHVVLGRAYLEKGALREAEAEFLKVIELAPDNLLVHRLLGDLYRKQERLAEAREHYEAVLTYNPLDREVRELLAHLPLPAEPKPHLLPPPSREEAPPSEGAVEEILMTETLADVYVQQGLLGEAAEIYRRLLEQDPSKGHLLKKLEILEGLREDLAKAPEVAVSPPGPPLRGEGAEAPMGEEGLLAIFERWLQEIGKLREDRRRGVSGDLDRSASSVEGLSSPPHRVGRDPHRRP